MLEALVWPQRRHYKKNFRGVVGIDQKDLPGNVLFDRAESAIVPRRDSH
jgi:hypothetical protein